MTKQEVMDRLAALGNPVYRAIYQRHGAGKDTFGVSFSELGKLRKAIGTNQRLASQLWRTGNSDARALATMIADPETISAAELDAWVKGVRYYGEADLVARYVVAPSPMAKKKAAQWRLSKRDFTGQVGWSVIAMLASDRPEMPEEYFEERLREIEAGIHGAGNRTRHAMNSALIAIGIRSQKLERLAVAAAKRIGKVQVDHGDTNCRTPDAASYIAKARAHAAKRSVARTSKAATAARKARA